MPGVHAVLTHDDVPGAKHYGLEFPDQPVLAIDRVRYFGEPVALVAAEHPEQARRAAETIRVEYEPLELVVDPERATAQEPLHPDRPTMGHGYRDDPRPNVVRHMVIRHGDPDATGEVTVSGRLRGRDPGPGVPRPGVGAGGPRRRGRRRHLRRHAVAARRPRPGRAVPRPAARAGAHPPRRRRRRLRRARGPVDADPRRDARAAHRAAGEARLRPRGVVRRPRPPPPGADPGRAPRDARRAARLRADARSCSTAAPTPRRSTAVTSNAASFACGPYDVAERADRVHRASTRTTRRAARCAASARSRPASPPRRRWTSSPPRSGSTRSSCGC